jgi:putative DNA primase/helicase
MTSITLSNSVPTVTIESLNSLCTAHYKELIEKRSLPLDWVAANSKSVTIQEASEVLGYPAKSPGILLQGGGWQIQFKPDKPWISDKDKALGNKKAPKYRTPQEYEGDYDAIAPTHPSDKTFWHDLEALKKHCWKVNGHHCVIITEGVFKAIVGCSHGLPTIALLGVEMGLTSSKQDPQGKRYLIPTLEKLAKAGFGFIIAFDADCVANKNVIEAEIKLAHQLKKFKVPVYSVTGKWSVEDGKGMDDYIKQKGIETFKQVLAEISQPYQAPPDDEKPKKKKPPTPEQLAARLVQEYQPKWAFHNEQKVWRVYNGKIWEEIETDAFMQLLLATVKAKGVEVNTPAYLENTAKFLKWQLLVKKWTVFDRKDWIAFNNGVLEVATGKVHKHSSGFRFTSCLQRDYQPLTFSTEAPTSIQLLANKCPVFYQWAMEAMNQDESKVLKLLAIVNGVIKFRFHDLQMFIHLIGKPGSGKGTFSRLLEKIVGKENHKSSRLEKLGDDYEVAKIIDSQLVICPDEDKQVGKYGGLKSLTGGDSVTYREIYKAPADSPFYGVILIISNSPIFAGDTSGLDRRMCLVSFQNKVPSYKRNAAIEQLLENELTALTSVALTLQDSEVTQTLRGIGDSEIPEFKREEWLLKCQLNSIAAWINERVVYDPEHVEYVSILFDDYRTYCGESGQKPFTLQNFSANLLQICLDLLGWDGVSKGRKTQGIFIKGIRLRKRGFDDHIPWIEESFVPSPPANIVADVDLEPTLCTPNVDLHVDLQPLQDKAYVDYVDQNQQFIEKEEALPIDNDEVEPNNSYLLQPEVYIPAETPTDNSSGSTCEPTYEATSTIQQIDWVRYNGEAWTVAGQKGNVLSLRKSGSSKIAHRVQVSEVEIGGYRQ